MFNREELYEIEVHSRNTDYHIQSVPMNYEKAVDFQAIHKQNGFITIMHMV